MSVYYFFPSITSFYGKHYENTETFMYILLKAFTQKARSISVSLRDSIRLKNDPIRQSTFSQLI